MKVLLLAHCLQYTWLAAGLLVLWKETFKNPSIPFIPSYSHPSESLKGLEEVRRKEWIIGNSQLTPRVAA